MTCPDGPCAFGDQCRYLSQFDFDALVRDAMLCRSSTDSRLQQIASLTRLNDANVKRIAELEHKIEQLRHISNVNGDWSMKHSKALERVKELENALRDLYALIEKGDLVRDITNDGQPDWALKMIPFMRALQNAQRMLET